MLVPGLSLLGRGLVSILRSINPTIANQHLYCQVLQNLKCFYHIDFPVFVLSCSKAICSISPKLTQQACKFEIRLNPTVKTVEIHVAFAEHFSYMQ